MELSQQLSRAHGDQFLAAFAWRRSWGVLSLYLDVQNVTNRASAEGT